MKVKCKECGTVFYPPKKYEEKFNVRMFPAYCTHCGRMGVLKVEKVTEKRSVKDEKTREESCSWRENENSII